MDIVMDDIDFVYEVPITNSGSTASDAYVYVEYSEDGSHDYISIAPITNNFSLEIGTNILLNKSLGAFTGTYIDSDGHIAVDRGYTGSDDITTTSGSLFVLASGIGSYSLFTALDLTVDVVNGVYIISGYLQNLAGLFYERSWNLSNNLEFILENKGYFTSIGSLAFSVPCQIGIAVAGDGHVGGGCYINFVLADQAPIFVAAGIYDIVPGWGYYDPNYVRDVTSNSYFISNPHIDTQPIIPVFYSAISNQIQMSINYGGGNMVCIVGANQPLSVITANCEAGEGHIFLLPYVGETIIYSYVSDYILDKVPFNAFYISPILYSIDKLKNSYIDIDEIKVSGGLEKNVEIRSSNTKPIALEELYWGTSVGLKKYNTTLGSLDIYWNPANYYSPPNCVAVSPLRNLIAYNSSTYLTVYNKDGILLSNVSATNSQFNKMEFSYAGSSIWGYSKILGTLTNINIINAADFTETYNLNKDDYIYDFSVEKRGSGIWYTNKKKGSLVHRDSYGTKLYEKYFSSPTAVASTTDNGCWVFESIGWNLHRVSHNGAVTFSSALDFNLSYIYSDDDDTVWYINGDILGHIDISGVLMFKMMLPSKADHVCLSPKNIYIYSEKLRVVYVIDKVTLVIINTFKNFGVTSSKPAVFYLDYDDQSKIDYKVFPLSYDPVWGDTSKLDWYTINKNGGELPKSSYYQLKFTFVSEHDHISTKIRRVLTYPTVKLENISPGESKSIYVKLVNIQEPKDLNINLSIKWSR
jgi:hypothetical protein